MLASPFHYQSQSQSQSQTPTSYFHHQTREFLPKIPSPLSPRSANINGSASSSNGYRQQQPNLMSSENDASTKQPQSSFTFNAPAPLPYSKRAIKHAPAVSQDALTERRRGMFLKKVREGREDRRFERHGEDIMRLDFVQRQKKWEAEQAKVAHSLPLDAPEEEEEGLDVEGAWGLPGSSGDAMQMSSQWDATPEEADEVARRESEELEELLSLLPGDASGAQYQHQHQQQEQNQTHQAQRQEDHFGSDDDDYDALFSDFINEEAHGMPEGGYNTHTAPSGDDAMDMS